MTFDIRFNANAREVLHLVADSVDDVRLRAVAKRSATHLRDEYPIENPAADDMDAVFRVNDQLLSGDGCVRMMEVTGHYVERWYHSLSLRQLQSLLVDRYEMLSSELVLFNLLYAEGVVHLSTDPKVRAEFRARKNAWLANDPSGEAHNAEQRRAVAAAALDGTLERRTSVDGLVAVCVQAISGAGYECAIQAAKIASRRSRFEFDATRLDNALADAIRVCIHAGPRVSRCDRSKYQLAALIVQEHWRNATRSE